MEPCLCPGRCACCSPSATSGQLAEDVSFRELEEVFNLTEAFVVTELAFLRPHHDPSAFAGLGRLIEFVAEQVKSRAVRIAKCP